MKQIIAFFSILFLLTGCSNDDSNQSNQTTVPFSVIAQSDTFPDDENFPKSNLVIKDAQAWTAFMTKINATNNETGRFTETNIDFTKYQIIAVVDKIYKNGGHSIDITKITEGSNHVIVKVEKLNTGNIATVITQPYHIVKIARTSKKVVFK